jgi:hypothetical protein
MPDLPAADGWVLKAEVPDGIFTLAVEADDETAAAEHAAFADRCLSLLLRAAGDDTARAERLRDEMIGQLGALRGAVAASGLGYLGAVADQRKNGLALILLGVAATPMEFPDGIDPASLLAAMLAHEYPDAAVEEFETASGAGVGMRRCESIHWPFGIKEREPTRTDTGISQALVPFPDAGLLGGVTGLCPNPADVDVATVFTAAIAYRMRAVPADGWAHGNRVD